MDNQLYKIFQISDVLIGKYEYSQVLLQQYQNKMSDEAWLFNSKNKDYQVIRISFYSAEQFSYDEERINDYLKFFKNKLEDKECKLLDIHINTNKYDQSNEPFDYINIDVNYNDGIDISNIFPEILNAIHNVEDPNKEITKLVNNISKNIKNKIKSRPLLKRYPYLCTYIICALCIINYILGLFLKYQYDDTSSVFVVLGADYKMFTLGLKQFYRLFSTAFVHNDIIHLCCNLFSLSSVGKYIEAKYGHGKFLLILFYSIIVGSLTQGILTDNDLCVGISGGIYGLITIFLIDMFKSRIINLRSLIPVIFINLFINILSNTAWMAHLGGAIAGYTIYYFFEDKHNYLKLALVIVLILSLFIKYATISSIKSIYGGTDLNTIEIYRDLGFEKYADRLLIKLINAYNKFGD